jgi:transcriptional regulator of aromatic amino acid metabolism
VSQSDESADLAVTFALLVNLAGEIRELSGVARAELVAFLSRQFERGAPAASVWEALALVVTQVDANARAEHAESAAIDGAIGRIEEMLHDPDTAT